MSKSEPELEPKSEKCEWKSSEEAVCWHESDDHVNTSPESETESNPENQEPVSKHESETEKQTHTSDGSDSDIISADKKKISKQTFADTMESF